LETLGGCPDSCENPGKRGLDFLGFPWIPSSESGLFNGLAEDFARKFLSAASPQQE
jgi:hypothetical protein